MSIESKFNEAVILTGFCALTLDVKLGAGVIAVGVGARILKELQTRPENQNGGQKPQQLNDVTVEPTGEVIDSQAK